MSERAGDDVMSLDEMRAIKCSSCGGVMDDHRREVWIDEQGRRCTRFVCLEGNTERAGRTAPDQWRAAANALREVAAEWDRKAEAMPPDICGVVSMSGPSGEPLACGYWPDHDGPHAWSTLPTYIQQGGGGCKVTEL